METEEFDTDQNFNNDEAFEDAPGEPGFDCPEEFEFDDWALI